jgi:putative membrane protein
MSQSLFSAWNFPLWACLTLEIVTLIYCRGWWLIRKTRPAQFPTWRLGCFLAGIFAIVIAICSPLDTFSNQLLFLHMAEHFVLMSIAPPLIVLAAPTVPMLRGLPRWFVRPVLGPLIRNRWLRKLFQSLVRLRVAWILMNAAYLGWHIPAAYEYALTFSGWHDVEHACFFFTSLLFWWPIIEPWPSHFTGSRWRLLPYLLAADIVNTGLSAFLCFAGRLVYPSYGLEPRIFGVSALADQAAAGALMWVFGSIVFLIPAAAITVQLLSPRRRTLAMRSAPSHL